MELELRTSKGTFDLYGNEDIVQTLSIFNLADISSRSGEYTNVFKLPLTNNNIKIIEYANNITTINNTPYQRIACDIYIYGDFFKNGFIEIESIEDEMSARFYSGNSNFYNLLKQISLQDLDWSNLDHAWNYTNAYNSCVNNYDYFYPVMDYNGQTLSGDILDIRKVLPATKVSAIISRLFSFLGYTYIANFSTSSINKMCLPYSKKNPTISAATQLYNSVDIQNSSNYTLTDQLNQTVRVFYQGLPANQTSGTYNNSSVLNTVFNQIVTPGSSINFDIVNQKYTAMYSGNYDFSMTAPLVDYDNLTVNFYPPIGSYNCDTYTALVCFKVVNGVRYSAGSVICSTGNKVEAFDGTKAITSISGIPQTSGSSTLNGTVYLQAGETLEFEIKTLISLTGMSLGSGGPYNTDYTNLQVNISSEIQAISTLTVDLQSELVFGGLITYSSILPNIKCSEFIRDLCVREGLILSVNEDDKTVTATKFDNIINNLSNSINWSDKYDESSKPNIKFKIDGYGQNNYFKHAEDKTVLNRPIGDDYNLTIDNKNLELEKTIYTSPFAATETRVFNGYNVAYISLYNVTDGKFGYDVKYRILYFDTIVSDFKVTDGTTTSGYVNTNKTYFIDDNNLTYAMGFMNNLIPTNSKPIIDILQNLKIVTVNINLNIVDIKSINFLYPIYIRQLQSYFFISSINQFDYTNPNTTEVELIKLN